MDRTLKQISSVDIETAVDWTMNEHGFVQGVRYHDGRLASWQFEKDEASFVIDTIGGGGTRFSFSGRVEFGSVGFVSDALISYVWARRLDRCDDLSNDLQEAIHVFFGGMYARDDLVMSDRLLLREEGRLLVYFTCSYGGPFSILADEMLTAKMGY